MSVRYTYDVVGFRAWLSVQNMKELVDYMDVDDCPNARFHAACKVDYTGVEACTSNTNLASPIDVLVEAIALGADGKDYSDMYSILQSMLDTDCTGAYPDTVGEAMEMVA